MENTVVFDFFRPEFRVDPYPFYREVREHDPVHWGISYEPGIDGMWHIASYADIAMLQRDPRFGRQLGEPAPAYLATLPEGIRLYFTLSSHNLLFIDPPKHTRLRGLVSKAFTPRAVEALRPRAQALATELLDAAERKGQIDIVNDYAAPLTITIISEMLGVGFESREQLQTWAGVLVRALDCKQSTDIYAQAGQVTEEIYAFFQDLIAKRRNDLRDDILSGLITAHEQGDKLSEDELVVMAVLLLIAGHETTVNLISNGMLSFMRNPDQLQLLHDQPDLISSAVEECLRYEPSAQMSTRVAAEDVEVHGKQIHRGDICNLLLGAGNRDPEAFTDPDRFDITRAESRHLSFGMGIHYCLGAPLARLEGHIALQELVGRHPTLRLLDEEPVWRDTISFRGLQYLNAAF